MDGYILFSFHPYKKDKKGKNSMEINKESLVRLIANKARFTYGDVRIILDALIEVFEESVSTETPINVRGWGKLYFQTLPERKGSKLVSDGKKLPPAKRVVFRLAKNIREIAK